MQVVLGIDCPLIFQHVFTFSRWIVTGDVLGHIKFYDENFRLMSWYSDFSLDAIASISFSKDAAPEPSQDYPESCILADQPFVSRYNDSRIKKQNKRRGPFGASILIGCGMGRSSPQFCSVR